MRGQSLIELLIAIGIFVFIISAVGFLLIRSQLANIQAGHYSQAVFLAEEGLAATQSIRDNNWSDLSVGSYGLTISNNHWVFQASEEDISNKLPQGKRKIIVEDVGQDRKKVTSQISWENPQKAQNKVELITFLTNWQKITGPPYCTGTPTPCSSLTKPKACRDQDGCAWKANKCQGIATPCGSYLTQTECLSQQGCQWVAP